MVAGLMPKAADLEAVKLMEASSAKRSRRQVGSAEAEGLTEAADWADVG